MAKQAPEVIIEGWKQQIGLHKRAKKQSKMFDKAINHLNDTTDPWLQGLRLHYQSEQRKVEERASSYAARCGQYRYALRLARGAARPTKRVDVAALKSQVTMRDVVERYTPVSRNNKALCHAHNDRRPSLHVYRDHGYCYVCNWRGDAIDYVMEREGIGFREALRKVVV